MQTSRCVDQFDFEGLWILNNGNDLALASFLRCHLHCTGGSGNFDIQLCKLIARFMDVLDFRHNEGRGAGLVSLVAQRR